MAAADAIISTFTHGVLWTHGEVGPGDIAVQEVLYTVPPIFRAFRTGEIPASRWGTVEGLFDVVCGTLSGDSPYEGVAFYDRAVTASEFRVSSVYWPTGSGNSRSAVIYSAASLAFVRYMDGGRLIPGCFSEDSMHPIVEGCNDPLIFFGYDYYHRKEGHDHDIDEIDRLSAWSLP